MTHNDYKQMIQFYLYDELGKDEKVLFEKHIKSCKECADEVEELKTLFSKISVDAKESIDDNIITELRQELRGAIRRENLKTNMFKQFFEKFSYLITKPTGLAFSGVTILLVGILIGYLFFNHNIPSNLIPVNDAENVKNSIDNNLIINNIKFIDSDPSDGEVEFTFDAVKHNRIKGKTSDPELQSILTYAILNEKNPGTRLNSINVINAIQSNKFDAEIRSALILAAKYDSNSGVRMKALKSLKVMPIDKEIKNTLIYVLMNDTSSGIKIEAINSLVEAAKKGFDFDSNDLSQLQKQANADANNYVRFQATNIIKEY